MPARRKNFPGRSRSASFWQSQSRSKPIHGMRWKRRPQARSAWAAIGMRPKTFGPSSHWLRPPIVRQRPALPVKGLHADDHTQREQRDDARSKKCVKPRLSVRPPLFAFQAASDDGEFAATRQSRNIAARKNARQIPWRPVRMALVEKMSSESVQVIFD
jgi:hypothetical protein